MGECPGMRITGEHIPTSARLLGVRIRGTRTLELAHLHVPMNPSHAHTGICAS